MKSERFEFTRTTPESVGISSSAVLRFLEEAEKEEIELHSIMLIRHGMICAENWWKPYTPEDLHPMWSFSKSLTSTAVGFAVQEGKLSLDDRLVDLFPDKLPESVSDNLAKANIHHLLTMSCGHAVEPNLWGHENWIAEFLAHDFVYEPGTVFQYNTQGTNMLAAALFRRTGENLTAYLRPRLLDPLDIGEIRISSMPDGIEAGGAGYQLRTEDMARFITFVADEGMWQGRQLLPKEWFKKATAKQIETKNPVYAPENPDWSLGYGYQYWRCQPEGVFRADGLYGQFGIVMPKQDAELIITEKTERTQEVLNMVWNILIPSMQDKALPEAPVSYGNFKRFMEHSSVKTAG